MFFIYLHFIQLVRFNGTIMGLMYARREVQEKGGYAGCPCRGCSSLHQTWNRTVASVSLFLPSSSSMSLVRIASLTYWISRAVVSRCLRWFKVFPLCRVGILLRLALFFFLSLRGPIGVYCLPCRFVRGLFQKSCT